MVAKHSARLLAILAYSVGTLFAQAPEFYAEVSPNPATEGQRITVTFTLKNGDGNINPPNFDPGLNVIYGPSQSQNYSYVNGKSSSSVTLRYVLVANNIGDYNINSATTKVKGKVLKTKPIQLKVEAGNSNTASRSSGQNNPKAPTTVKTTKNANILFVASTNKTSVYVNEPVTITYTLYSRYNRLQPTNIKLPDPSNFWKEDIELEQRAWDRDLAVINGMQYRKIVMAQRVLYPQKSGDLSTGVAEIEAVANAGFFSAGQEMSAQSDDLRISVKPLPKNRPGNFSGFVGKLLVESSLNKDSVEANGSLKYTLTLSGEGNFKLLNPPTINFPEDFEVFEPKTKNNVRLSYSGYKGKIVLEYLLIPRYSGDYDLPEVDVAYFDLSQKKYRSARSKSLSLTVSGDAKPGVASAGGLIEKNAVDDINTDIHYIVSKEPSATKSEGLKENSTLVWSLRMGLKLAFLLGLFLIKKQEDLSQDIVGMAASKASRKALKRLKGSHKNQDYSVLYKAYTQFLSEKFNLPLSTLTKSKVEEKLKALGKSEENIQAATQIIEACEMASFAPSTAKDFEQLLQKTIHSIKQLA